MKLTFENLGPLEQGELELAELTILCGHNNSGKTYVTYVLYCLLTSLKQLTQISLKDEIDTLNTKGVVQINLEEKIVKAWPEIGKSVLAGFSAALPEMLAVQSSLLANTRLNWEFAFGTQWQEKPFSHELRSGKGEVLVSIIKPANSVIVDITATGISGEFTRGEGIRSILSHFLVDILFDGTIPETFIASCERTGATIFQQELRTIAPNSADWLKAMGNIAGTVVGNAPWVDLSASLRRNYNKPIKDNVRFVNRLPDSDQEHGDLIKQHPELLEAFSAILGGQYVTNKEGVTHFQLAKSGIHLGLGETSSAVRSLLLVWYWLKYQARPGSMLMIDEPELNLHPDNQRRLARFLVRLVNLGVRVFITTHSDYIIRELNTLIMLSRNLPHYNNVRQSHGYAADEQLLAKQALLYVTGKAKFDVAGSKKKQTRTTLLKIVPDEKQGLDADTFDQTILDMNQMQDDLRYGGA